MAERLQSPPPQPSLVEGEGELGRASSPSPLAGEGGEGGEPAAHPSRRPAGAPQGEEESRGVLNQLPHPEVRGDSRASKDEEQQRPRHPEKVNRPSSPPQRKPDWIRVKAPVSREYQET